MEIIKDNIEEVLKETSYVYQKRYLDDKLNCLYNYWYFFDRYAEEQKDIRDMRIETILYSKYFWFSRFAERFYEVFGFDAGIEQQQFMIVDEIEQRLDNVDWNYVQRLCKENRKNR